MAGLSSAEMEEVGRVFRQTEEETAAAFLDEKAVEEIANFRFFLATSFLPYTAVTAKGLGPIRDSVFNSQVISDFVLSLLSKFAMRWANEEDSMARLNANLARGCSFDYVGNDNKKNDSMYLMPKPIRERTTSRADVVMLLNHNPWMSVLMLSSLYPSLQLPVPKVSRQRNNNP